MSRPQKLHKPLKADFRTILGAVAIGHGAGRKTAIVLARQNLEIKPTSKPVEKPKG